MRIRLFRRGSGVIDVAALAGMAPPTYHLGLPAWAFPGWKDRYFSDTPSRLASYASVFDTVEGNTTFYRTPDSGTVARWKEAVTGRDFRFCFKLPREVTHERHPDLVALGRFLDAIEPLGEHLGPLLVQFPATMGPADLETFEPVFGTIRSFRAVVEVRHPAFFEEPALLEDTLDTLRAGRVMLDSRPLYDGNLEHPEVQQALHEKPDVPVLDTVYNDVALVRLILHPDLVSNAPYLDEWVKRCAAWLDAGIDTYMMIHCPNNLHCPPLALDFYDRLRSRPGCETLPPLPLWPVPSQQGLF